MTYHFLIHSIDQKQSLLGRLSNYPGIPSCVYSRQIQIPICYWEQEWLKKSRMSGICNLELGGGHFLYICTILGVDENQIDG